MGVAAGAGSVTVTAFTKRSTRRAAKIHGIAGDQPPWPNFVTTIVAGRRLIAHCRNTVSGRRIMQNIVTGIAIIAIGFFMDSSLFLGDFTPFNIFFDGLGLFFIGRGLFGGARNAT